MRSRLGLVTIAAIALLGLLPGHAWAQAQRVGVCLERVDANGINQCADGWTTKLLNALTNTAVAVKATPGLLGKLYCYNPNASVAYIQVFNLAAASVTVGTTVPAQSYGIPQTNANGFAISVGDAYSTAISVAATTTATGSTAPGTAIDCNASFN